MLQILCKDSIFRQTNQKKVTKFKICVTIEKGAYVYIPYLCGVKLTKNQFLTTNMNQNQVK